MELDVVFDFCFLFEQERESFFLYLLTMYSDSLPTYGT